LGDTEVLEDTEDLDTEDIMGDLDTGDIMGDLDTEDMEEEEVSIMFPFFGETMKIIIIRKTNIITM